MDVMIHLILTFSYLKVSLPALFYPANLPALLRCPSFCESFISQQIAPPNTDQPSDDKEINENVPWTGSTELFTVGKNGSTVEAEQG